MILPLDGPATQKSISLTTTVVVEVKGGASALPERKAVIIQATNGDIYIYFGDGTNTPVAATVQSDGLIQYEGSKEVYEASDSQKIFILAVNATTKTIIVERA